MDKHSEYLAAQRIADRIAESAVRATFGDLGTERNPRVEMHLTRENLLHVVRAAIQLYVNQPRAEG
jgi:hypothetical protein